MIDNITLKNNVSSVRKNIEIACQEAGRDVSEIQLVAATKMNGAEIVKEALKLDIDISGENRVQELLEKYDEGAYEGKPLHFIGNLQTNKVKYLIGKVDLIHSVNSVKLASAISKEALKKGIVQDILIEVNIADEESKGGIPESQIYEVLSEIAQMKGVYVCGLMTIPPKCTLRGENNHYFNRMYQLFIDISKKKYDNVSMRYLSMGMSDDYQDAIMCGANMIRVGTAIFGSRNYVNI